MIRLRHTGSPGNPLGTTIVGGGKGISRGTVRTYCMESTLVPGLVCCKYLGGGQLPDGTRMCPVDTGPVPPDLANVTLEMLDDGRVQLVAGPPRTQLSQPFRLPGDTRPPPKDEPPDPGTPVPAEEESWWDKYGAWAAAGALAAIGLLAIRATGAPKPQPVPAGGLAPGA